MTLLRAQLADGRVEGRCRRSGKNWTCQRCPHRAFCSVLSSRWVQKGHGVWREGEHRSRSNLQNADDFLSPRQKWPGSLIILTEAKAHQAHHTINDSASAINTCSKATKWDRAIEVLKDVRNLNLKPNVVIYNALATAQPWHQVVNLMCIMYTRSVQADQITFGSAIHSVSSSISSSVWLKAALLFDESRMRSIICDVVSCNSAMSTFDAAFEWSRCLKAFEDLRCWNVERNVMVSNTVLSACSRVDLWQESISCLNSLFDNGSPGLQPTVVTRGIVMSACAFLRQWAFALHQMSFLSLLGSGYGSARHAKGNIAICSIGISACAFGSLWKEAVSLCLVARCLEGEVKVRSFNDAIAACGRRGQWQWALWLLSEAGQGSNVVTYAAAITACGESKWQHALLVFSSLKSSHLEVNIISYNSIITALGEQWKEVLHLLDELYAQQLAPDSITFGASVSACRAGQWEVALELLTRLCEERVQMEAITLTAAIDACGTASRWDLALVLLSELCGKDAIAYNAAINACGDVDQWQIALQLLNEAKSDASTSSLELVFTSVIAGCRRRWQLALQLLTELQETQETGETNLYAYNAALGACDEAGQWLYAVVLFQELADQDLQPDMISFGAALGACRQSPGAWHFAIPFSRGLRDRLLKLLDFAES